VFEFSSKADMTVIKLSVKSKQGSKSLEPAELVSSFVVDVTSNYILDNPAF